MCIRWWDNKMRVTPKSPHKKFKTKSLDIRDWKSLVLYFRHTITARARDLWPEVQLHTQWVKRGRHQYVRERCISVPPPRISKNTNWSLTTLFPARYTMFGESVHVANLCTRYATPHTIKVRLGPLLSPSNCCSSAATAACGIHKCYSIHSVGCIVHNLVADVGALAWSFLVYGIVHCTRANRCPR